MEKDAFYFPHFCNARHDRKIKRVRKELGLEGYGIFFMLLEVLREQTDYRFPVEDLDLLADEFGTSEQKVRTVVCNYDLFELDNSEHFFSSRLIMYLQPYLEGKEHRRVSGIKGNLIRYKYFTKEELEDKTDSEILELAKGIEGFSLPDSHSDRLPMAERSGQLAKERKGNTIQHNEINNIEPEKSASVVDDVKPISKMKDNLAQYYQELFTSTYPDSGWTDYGSERSTLNTLAKKTRNLLKDIPSHESEFDLSFELFNTFVEMIQYGRHWKFKDKNIVPTALSTCWAETVTALAEKSRVVESNDLIF